MSGIKRIGLVPNTAVRQQTVGAKSALTAKTNLPEISMPICVAVAERWNLPPEAEPVTS